MVKIRLKHIVSDIDRHGNVRRYVRIPGMKKIRLKSEPGTTAFQEEYTNALAAAAANGKSGGAAEATSLRWLVSKYVGSTQFAALDNSTRLWRRRALEDVCVAHGEKPFAGLEARHVRALRDALAEKPGAANSRLKALRALFAWAASVEITPSNPAREVPLIRYKTTGHHSWTISEVEKFEAVHLPGTTPRLAMALLLYTACRREDVVRLGPSNIAAGRLRYVQAKNEDRTPVEVDIPVHAALDELLAGHPPNANTFLITAYGKPYSVAGFGNRFREWCDAAGLKHCSAHGLRKAAATRLADSGASPHEIMAITGHRTLAEVERYTRAVAQRQLATRAMERLEANRPIPQKR